MPRIPRGLAERPPELAALLRGDLEPAQLHPLAHAALFPAAAPVAPAPAPPAPLREAIHVRCHGETHELRIDGGFVTPHSETELDRERVVGALGGRMPGCAAAVEGWRNPALRRIPRPLVSLRIQFLRRFADADTAAVADALDRGLDPHLRDERGRTLLHRLAWLPDADLLPRLLAAGLDLQERDRRGRTPLQLAAECGAPELVRALLAAGAK